ncbi:MAG: sulfurtransferase [Gemmatimonadales bacterium]
MVNLMAAATLLIAPTADTLLVSPDWLAGQPAGRPLTILHAARTAAAFDSAHVPGARPVLLSAITETHGTTVTELPAAETLRTVLGAAGVGDKGLIVVYGAPLDAARLWFTLDYLGLGGRSRIMDGGLAAWIAGGHATAGGPAPPGAGRPRVAPRADVVATTEYVAARRDDPAVLLLDARTADEFAGRVEEAGVSRPGHIPGSTNLDWTTLMENGRFRPMEALERAFAAAGARPDREIVALCRSGTRAAALYVAARLLGYRTRLYDGSMNEWSSRADLPVAREYP